METDKGFFGKMKTVINIIAFIIFVGQFLSFIFNAFNLQEARSTKDSLYQFFFFTAFLCSLITVIIFVLMLNFDFKYLKRIITNSVFLVITLLGLYIHLLQLFKLKDFVLTSCVLIIMDCYIMHNILQNVVHEYHRRTCRIDK